MLPPKAREMANADVKGPGIEMQSMGGGAGMQVQRQESSVAEQKSIDVTEDMKHSLNHQFNKYGVQIIDVAIQRVRLPPKFEKQMEERTTYGAIIEEQKMRQLSEMQLIKQGEEVQTVNQKNKEDQEKEVEVGTRAVAQIRKKLDAVNAESAKMVAAIKEDQSAKVREIVATSNLKVQELDSETIKVLTEHDAKAKASSEKLLADTDAFVMKKLAEAELEEEKCKAKSKEVIAKAEGAAAKKLQHVRHYKLQKQQIAMYSALAENPNLVVTGTGGKGQSLLADMMVSQKQSQILLQVDGTK